MEKNIEKYIRIRRPLWHTAEAIRRGEITIGFMGGSITDGGRNAVRWSDKIGDWFVAAYPNVNINIENAAKGATGSLSAILRVNEDILSRHCDIVFVETAVNDRLRAHSPCREGFLRKLLRDDSCDVVLTYTYCQDMYEDMMQDKIPESIAIWEAIAEHYHISSAFMGKYAFDLVQKGFLRWEEWLPDGLHPQHAGSRIYAEPVSALLERSISEQKTEIPMPEPLNPDHWENTYALPFAEIRREGAWRVIHEKHIPSVEYILSTTQLGARLLFSFEGRGVLIHEIANNIHAAYRYRIDGGAWVECADELPAWGMESTDWVREEEPILGLTDGKHTMEIETMFRPNTRGSLFELSKIGIVR